MSWRMEQASHEILWLEIDLQLDVELSEPGWGNEYRLEIDFPFLLHSLAGTMVFSSCSFFSYSSPLQFLSFHITPTSLRFLFPFCLILVHTMDSSRYSLHLLYASPPSYSVKTSWYPPIPVFATHNILPPLSSLRFLLMYTQGITVLWPSNAYNIQNVLLWVPIFSIWGHDLAE